MVASVRAGRRALPEQRVFTLQDRRLGEVQWTYRRGGYWRLERPLFAATAEAIDRPGTRSVLRFHCSIKCRSTASILARAEHDGLHAARSWLTEMVYRFEVQRMAPRQRVRRA